MTMGIPCAHGHHALDTPRHPSGHVPYVWQPVQPSKGGCSWMLTRLGRTIAMKKTTPRPAARSGAASYDNHWPGEVRAAKNADGEVSCFCAGAPFWSSPFVF
mmetsp:Transcript_79576/g.257806  ORF Transcript_79576/g.257806 Transcript_79576/m.257806 type:complete len:102 (+) Transcript_79576:254-559(+)